MKTPYQILAEHTQMLANRGVIPNCMLNTELQAEIAKAADDELKPQKDELIAKAKAELTTLKETGAIRIYRSISDWAVEISDQSKFQKQNTDKK